MGPVLPLEQRKLRPRRPSHRAKGRVLRGGGVRTGVSAAKCSSTMATFSQKHHVASCGPLPGVAVVRRLGSPQREAQAGRRAQSGAHGSSLLGRRHYRCPKYSHPARCSDPDTPHAASSSAARSPPPPPLVCPANSHFFSGFRSNTASGGLSRLQGPRRWPHPDANGRDEECGGPRERQGLCLLAPPMQWIGGSRSCTCEETGSCREHVTQRDTPGQG